MKNTNGTISHVFGSVGQPASRAMAARLQIMTEVINETNQTEAHRFCLK